MDSDSSIDDEMDCARWNQGKALQSRNNMNDTSDVSDEENISRAARSIESPPESPQGGHFESPPASPDSISPPHSPDDSGSSRRGSESPINSPEMYHSDRQGSVSPNHSEASVSSLHQVSQLPHDKFCRDKAHDVHSPMHSTPQRSESELSRQERNSPVHSPSSSVRSLSQRSESRLSRLDRDSPNHSPSSSIHSPLGSENNFLRQQRASPNHSSNSYIQSPHRGNESLSSKQERESQNNSPRSYINSPQSPIMPSQVTNEIASPAQDDGHIPDSNSDDGRSNISSVSSFGSLPRRSPMSAATNKTQSDPVPTRVKTAAELKSHAEDLSDVSDLESLDSVSDDDVTRKVKDKMQVENCEKNKNISKNNESKNDINNGVRSNTAAAGLEGEDTEQLDFEADEKEEGECEGINSVTAITAPVPNSSKIGGSEDEGELKNDELEEGELTDEGENRPEETEPRPICRFYNRGQCTWGSSCRFVHPGVTDKGNYTMFELVRPLVPVNGPPQMYPPMDYRPVERPVVGVPSYQPFRKEEAVPVVESAWERGLRQAKEMLRKSSKRKETEVDFEEKKMNLTLGQDELDKENDYYTRSASPVLNEEPDRWSGKIDGDPKRYRTVSERYEADYGPESAYYHSGSRSGEVWHHRGHHYVEEGVRSSRLVRGDPDYHSSSLKSKYSSSHYYSKASSHDYYERKRHKYPSREVIVQRSDKSSWKDDSPTAPSRSSRHVERGGRGDEWADPWMRSKSPLGRKTRSRKQSYSSGSSYSSSSSSRTSRSSSGSSYSRDSRSRSRSSRSRSRSKKPVSPVRRLIRPSSPFNKSKPLSPGLIMSEKRAATERALHMNPPPPSPRKVRGPGSPPAPLRRNPTPPTSADNRTRGGVPPRLLAHSKAAVAAAMRSTRSHSKSSRSSSGSDSSGSSSDSSESSFSSTSSSRVASPPARQKRIVIDERLALAQAMKVKAMDALKLSGQKQQIKLTLKGSGASQVDRPPSSVTTGKKRPAESPPAYIEESSPPKVGGKTTPKKPAPSRREELLKQLKAVEDAIARKRSKIV